MGSTCSSNKLIPHDKSKNIDEIVHEIICIYKTYGSFVKICDTNKTSVLNASIYNSMQALKYIEKNLPDIFYYKKKCIVATVFLCYLGMLLKRYKLINTSFYNYYNLDKKSNSMLDAFYISKLYISYLGLPNYIVNMIEFQKLLYKDDSDAKKEKNKDGANSGVNDELVGMNCANTQYDDAKIVCKFLNSYKENDIVEYGIDEKEKLLNEIKQIICGTILI